MVTKNNSQAGFTVPGLELKDGHAVAATLQSRLHALNDLQLTLKHAHWNVVGRDFIGVHEMLDPQIDLVRAMIDETAERMATLGVSPNGLAGALVKARDWDDTRSAGPGPTNIWPLWTWSTPASSRATERPLRQPAIWTPSPRTCSLAKPASWSCSSGS